MHAQNEGIKKFKQIVIEGKVFSTRQLIDKLHVMVDKIRSAYMDLNWRF